MRKLRLVVMTTLMTFSCSVMAEASFTDSAEAEGLVEPFGQSESVTEIANFDVNDIPFMDIMEGLVPPVYPPLEYIKEDPATYVVMEGDNLFRIAIAHGISVFELMSWNGLENDLIYPGDVLTISGEGETGKSLAPTESLMAAASTVQTTPKDSQLKTAFKSAVATPPTTAGTEMVVTATAYTAYCTGCSGTTAYGIDLRANPHMKVIAVDPTIIPLGTLVWVEGYGEAIAGDVGGAIKGHKIDVFIPTYESAMDWGVKKVRIKVLN